MYRNDIFLSSRRSGKSRKQRKQNIPETAQNQIKIEPGSHQNKDSKKRRETIPENHKNRGKWVSNWGPKGGQRTKVLPPVCCPKRTWEPKWLQDLPQEPPGPPQASIFDDFGLIFG